jgi:hypothetical protein
VAKYDSAGTLVWVKQAGGIAQDGGLGIAVDRNGNSYVTGQIFQFPATFGAGEPNETTLTGAGQEDIFVAKYISGETPTGENVTVTPVVDPNPVVHGPVGVTFAEVTQTGITSVAITSPPSGTPPPTGFTLGDPPVYFNITTGATFVPPITVCIKYTGITFADENMLRLFHQTGGVWEDVTTRLDIYSDIICGTSSSLSPFAPGKPSYKFAGFFNPVQNDSVVNLAKAGSTIPLKWQLRAEGGGFVSALSAVTGIRYQERKCSDSTLLYDLVLADSTGNSGLKISGNQYHYNWKTAKNMAKKCYRLNVELFRFDVHSADFQMW